MFKPFTKNKSSTKPFIPHQYCVLFDECLEVEESRENFFQYLCSESMCKECVDFLRDFRNYRDEYAKAKNLAGSKKKKGGLAGVLSSSVSSSLNGIVVEQVYVPNDDDSSCTTTSSSDSSSLNLKFSSADKKQHSYENIELVLSGLKRVYVLAESLMENYISSHVLNVPSWIIKQTKIYWNSVLDNINKMVVEYDSVENNSNGTNSSTGLELSSLLEKINEENGNISLLISLAAPSKLFLRVYENLLIDLKLDTFSRYARSDYLHQFLKKMGESFTKRIAIHIDELDNTRNSTSSSEEETTDLKPHKEIRLRTDDWNSNTFTKQFIFNCLYFADDSPKWKSIMRSKKKPFPQSRYITVNDFVMGKGSSSGQKCSKVVMEIPYNRDFVYALYSSMVTRVELDPWMKEINYYGISKNEHEMTTTAAEVVFSLGPLQKRSFTILGTNMYDPDADCFMFFFKTIEFEEYQRSENTVPAECFMVFLFYKVTDNLTRFVNVFYGDLKLPLSNDFTFKFATSMGAKKINKLLEKVAKKYLPQYEQFEQLNGVQSYYDFENPADYIDSIFKFEDDLKTYETIKQNLIHFPVKSWHREFKDIKR